MPTTSSHRLVFLRSCFALLALLPVGLSAATEIHISPVGNDANVGTAALPLATPQGAQVRVRSLIQAGLTDSVNVNFAAGTYVMTAPLELRPADSGTAAFPVTWKAAAGAEVVLSGGRTITSTWTNGGGGIWFTDLTGIGLGTNQWNFRQLFVNGSRATRARYPNVTESNPFLYATGGDFAYLTIAQALVKSSWGTASDAQINVVPQSRFFNQWNTITSVNTSTGRIDIADSERHRLINSGSWFWIEGVQEELDAPGEWFLNPTTGRLSYMPPAGVDPNTLTFIAPVLNRLVNAKGDVNAGTHVAHVHFEGLKFFHTSFTLGHIEARVHTDTVIMFENTRDSSVKNCYFENIGGYALWLHLDSQRNVFDHNSVQNSGGGGVLLTGSRFAYMDDSKIYTPGTAAAKVAPILNVITHNTVEHCGKIRYYGGGVHLDSRPFSMTMAPGNYIAHNHFNDLSRNGVFAFRNQGGNVIEYNHIHNAMQTTIDGGCIHFATMNTLNAPNHILNNWLYDAWGYNQLASGTPERKLANGVFLDWDTSNTTVKDNWIYNVVGGAVKVIFGGNRNVVQGGNQSSATVITPPFVAEVGPGGAATNGIDLATNQSIGSVISYQDTANFSQTGTWTEETAVGLVNLFEFKFLTATAAVPSQATFTLPIPQDGTYEISLIYYRGSNRASNVPVAIDHADGLSNISWNMQQGSNYGFAVPVGTYRYVASETNTVKLSSIGANGKVIADAVAFVKVENSGPVQSRFIRNISQGIPQKVVLYGTSLTATGAWVSQLQSAVEETSPGMATWVNSGGSGQASDWGVTNLQTKVINHDPDTVFIEFSMNDAATTLNISRAQALANLTSMVTDITSAHPSCEIILQIMNPVDRRETDAFSPRPDLALYQQDYRDFAASNGLQCIDHMPAFMALFDEGSVAYRTAVPDGVHPSAEGFARYLSPVLSHAIGLATQSQNDPLVVIDNTDPAPAIVFNGDWTPSTATGGYIGADYRHNGNTAQGSKSAVFTPTITSSGTYPIFLRWTGGTNRATNVPVTVNYSGGSQTITVNQTTNGGTWVLLGTFPFAAGTSATVTIGTAATNGFVIVDALGIGENSPVPTVRLRMDNGRAAEPAVLGGAARASSLIVWRSGPTLGSVSVPLVISGGTATSGSDYAVLPTSITIPAGQSSAAVDMLPLHDLLAEGDETFKVALGTVAGYAADFPSRASIVLENSGGTTTNTPPVASGVTISGTAAVGQSLQGNYTYSDAQSDTESGTTFRWLRSTDATLDVSDTVVGTATSYMVQAADVGKRLFFEVTPIAATGVTTGNAAASTGVLIPNPQPPGRIVLVEENFASSGALHASNADTFSTAITTASGSSTWAAGTGFLQNGAVSGGNIAASLNLGNYLNAAKNTADGKFELRMTISEVTGTWISLGFGAENIPSTTKNFTSAGTTGLGTIIYRAQTGIVAPSANGELDMFGGTTNTNAIDGPNGNTGARTLTVTLDVTPAGGYNGTSNFGTVIWSDSVLGSLGNYTYTTNRSFGSILLSNATGSTGTVSALRLTQVMASTNASFADWLTTNAPATGFLTDSDNDGLPNGVEHVLGGNPNNFTSGLTEVSSTPTSITFNHKLNQNIASDVTYRYQWSTDLTNWHESSTTNATGTGATITPSVPDANQLVTVAINITGGPAAKLFGRLEATQGF